MAYRNEQPTLFELTACAELAPLRGLAGEQAPANVAPKSDPSTLEDNVFSTEPGVFKAVSPWATMPLGEVCAACGSEIKGSGFVILDYEELGAFCGQDCGDRRFRSYLYEVSETATS